MDHSPHLSPGGSQVSDGDDYSDGPHDFKRLIVCCDGTWLDDSDGIDEGKLVPPSNVTRLTRAINSVSDDGIVQIVYYQAGVGSSGTIGNKVVGGATGAGLAEHVREAYAFICNNYNTGDEIFLIGFSRGAFTARSVGGLIANIGVMNKQALWTFPVVYQDFTHRYDKRFKSKWKNIPYPDKPSFRDPIYAQEMQRRKITRLGIPIKAIGVFDTVGSLGIPKVSWLGKMGQQSLADFHEYGFYDTSLDPLVLNAFQALALDEKRAAFQPALWEKRNNKRTNLIQVWFPGVHSNIGGGYDDQELSNITLAWMMSMLQPLLSFNLNYLMTQERQNLTYYKDSGKNPRPWSFGKIYDSVTGLFKLGGSSNRTPGDYYRADPRTGDYTNKPLRHTNEYIHSSVRSRYVMNGPGYNDKGDYAPKALKNWKLKSDPNVQGLPTPWFWEDQGEEAIILPEAPLRSTELMLLKTSPDVYDYVMAPPRAPRRGQPDKPLGYREESNSRKQDTSRSSAAAGAIAGAGAGAAASTARSSRYTDANGDGDGDNSRASKRDSRSGAGRSSRYDDEDVNVEYSKASSKRDSRSGAGRSSRYDDTTEDVEYSRASKRDSRSGAGRSSRYDDEEDQVDESKVSKRESKSGAGRSSRYDEQDEEEEVSRTSKRESRSGAGRSSRYEDDQEDAEVSRASKRESRSGAGRSSRYDENNEEAEASRASKRESRSGTGRSSRYDDQNDDAETSRASRRESRRESRRYTDSENVTYSQQDN